MNDMFASSPIPVKDREIVIMNYLRALQPGEATSVRAIWEGVKDELNDTVTVQAYHKILDRLVAVGRVEQASAEPEQGKLYRIAPYLHAANPATLDRIWEWVTSSLPPSEIIAKTVDATDYLQEKKNTTIKRAAEALLDEDPVELFYDMLLFYLDALQADLEICNHRHPDTQNPELRDEQLIKRILHQYHKLDWLLYRYLSIPTEIVDITDIARGVKQGEVVRLAMDKNGLRETLRARVFGEKFIVRRDVSGERGTAPWLRMSVAGSDGSTHSGALAVHTAAAFFDHHGLIVTFNNSMAYVEQPRLAPGRIPYPFHSVPMSRSALDNPSNRGMVLTPVMFPDLSDSEYEHMAKCATDVVQWRVDAAVFSGLARALSPEGTLAHNYGMLLPAPTVHLRDGTVTLQEREFKHYKRQDAYGEFVREGVNLSKQVLERIKSLSSGNRRVFGGAAKSTRIRIFSEALDWYITEGSKKRFGEPIDPDWHTVRAAQVSDNEAMTVLLSALTNQRGIKDGEFYTTCVVVRQFHSLTERYKPDLPKGVKDSDRWHKYFKRLRDHESRQRQELGGDVSHLELVEIEDDPFVWMCANADYGMFYIGHTGGDPAPQLPRYEFLDSLRELTPEQAAERVQHNIERILQALDQTRFQLDQDHNYLTNKRLVKIIPQVVYTAHEHCKALGHRLESELKSWIVARLQQIRKVRGLRPTDVELVPVSIEEYVERYKKAIEDDLREDPGKLLR